MWTHESNLYFVYPHQVLAELKKSNFTLLNQSIEFDENGDPKYGSFSILFWNQTVDTEEVGLYYFNPSFHFFINNSKIQWHNKNKVSHFNFLLRVYMVYVDMKILYFGFPCSAVCVSVCADEMFVYQWHWQGTKPSIIKHGVIWWYLKIKHLLDYILQTLVRMFKSCLDIITATSLSFAYNHCDIILSWTGAYITVFPGMSCRS